MATPTRHAMRLLSPRLQSLSRRTPFARHMATGRYSHPTRPPPGGSSSMSSQAEINPMDRYALEKAYYEERAYRFRRMRFAGLGLILTLVAMTLTVYSIDLDELEKSAQKQREQQALLKGKGMGKGGYSMDASREGNQRFQGKEVVVIGAGEDKRIVAQGNGEEVDLVETGTSSVPLFPRTIYLPAQVGGEGTVVAAHPDALGNPGNIGGQEEYTLVGLGIRTVMWIQVYVVGFYIRTTDISTLQEKLIHSVNPIASTLVPGEKTDLKKKLLDPEGSREIWSDLLKVPGIKTAWRISPTRSTDFGHLRDGFVNGINARTQEAKRLTKGAESEFDQEDFGQAVQSLKGVFSGGKAPKGSILILTRGTNGALNVLYQPKPDDPTKQKETENLGSVADERIARLIWLGYLAGDKVSSKAARDGVVDGCITFATRPIGSVETRVI